MQRDRCMSRSSPLCICMNVIWLAAHERKDLVHDKQNVVVDVADDCIILLYASHKSCRSGPCTTKPWHCTIGGQACPPSTSRFPATPRGRFWRRGSIGPGRL